jgi:hypothetical protein
LTSSTFGDITIRVMPAGRFEARTRYRDWDGQTRQVQASGDTARAAERALKSKLTTRYLQQPTDTSLMPDSSFDDLATYWLEDIDMENRIVEDDPESIRAQHANARAPRVSQSHAA